MIKNQALPEEEGNEVISLRGFCSGVVKLSESFGLCRLNHLHRSEEADGLTSPYSQRLDSATQAAELSAESVCECE